jgi:hypothetical protein
VNNSDYGNFTLTPIFPDFSSISPISPLPAADATLRSQLDGLEPQLAGKALLDCR